MPDANDSPYRNNLCSHPGPREELVETAGLDGFERAALDMIRKGVTLNLGLGLLTVAVATWGRFGG